MANKYQNLSSDELRARMMSGSFFPEPSESDFNVTSATPVIAILHYGVDERHTSARKQLNRWLVQWNCADVKDIVMRLTSEREQHHESALWELYLNSLFIHLGFSVIHEPLSLNTFGNEKAASPDFLIEKDGALLLVEAVTISRTPKETDKKIWTDILDYLQKQRRADFWIGINPTTSTTSPPRKTEILAQINSYLDSCDSIIDSGDEQWTLDYFPICVDGWEFELRAQRISEGTTFDSFVGMWGNLDTGVITDTSDLRSQIMFKRSKYGKELPHNFVIAVLENSFMGGIDDFHRFGALFGEAQVHFHDDGSVTNGRKANGIWNNGKIDTRLSGLLLLAGMRFGADELPLPEFWINPYMNDSLQNLFPFTFWRADGDSYSKTLGLKSWNPLS